MTPIIQKVDEVSHSFPCGKCEKCVSRRISGWSFRLMQQEKRSTSGYFVTLTYAPERCPITRNRYMTLVKSDLQKYFKRLRKAHEKLDDSSSSIKYYACGEYGGKSWRPHYHIILFNADLEIMIGKVHADLIRRQLIPLSGEIPFSSPQWEQGHITIGEATAASVGYTMKYISKQKRIPLHRNDDREKEFALMSKGLGIGYINDVTKRYHKDDLLNRMCLTIEDGKKIAMPRYYKDKIYTPAERSEIAGFQKGEIEKRFLEQVEKELSLGDEQYRKILHNKKQAIEHSFALMHEKAEQGRNKI